MCLGDFFLLFFIFNILLICKNERNYKGSPVENTITLLNTTTLHPDHKIKQLNLLCGPHQHDCHNPCPEMGRVAGANRSP